MFINTTIALNASVLLVKAVSEPGPENSAFHLLAHHVTSPDTSRGETQRARLKCSLLGIPNPGSQTTLTNSHQRQQHSRCSNRRLSVCLPCVTDVSNCLLGVRYFHMNTFQKIMTLIARKTDLIYKIERN